MVYVVAFLFSAAVWALTLPILWAAIRAWRKQEALWIGLGGAGAMPLTMPFGRIGTLIVGLLMLGLALLPVDLLVTALSR
jgi:hypothetical protein